MTETKTMKFGARSLEFVVDKPGVLDGDSIRYAHLSQDPYFRVEVDEHPGLKSALGEFLSHGLSAEVDCVNYGSVEGVLKQLHEECTRGAKLFLKEFP